MRLYAVADEQFYDAAGVIKYDIFCSASGGAIKRDEVTVEGGGRGRGQLCHPVDVFKSVMRHFHPTIVFSRLGASPFLLPSSCVCLLRWGGGGEYCTVRE
jgi:hypothetical protein